MHVLPSLRLVLGLIVLAVVVAVVTIGVIDVLQAAARPQPAARAIQARAPTVAVAPAMVPPSRSAPCFGAASADPGRPCVNPALAGSVFPAPSQARAAQRSAGCRRSQQVGLLRVCFWGTPVQRATRTVVLVGDSHASHWRAALQTVARARRWRAISISRAGCPFTLARADLPGPARKAGCLRWNAELRAWFGRHREIDVVFTGAHRGRVLPRPGQQMRTTQRLGYARAWQRLLSLGVSQVVVLRDTPRISGMTLPCVTRAIERGQAPGEACALPRRYALRPDPAAQAVAVADSARIQLADLSRFFCDPELCRPVIGGALVLRDVSHMTTTFSTTLGPALLQTVDRLSQTWR